MPLWSTSSSFAPPTRGSTTFPNRSTYGGCFTCKPQCCSAKPKHKIKTLFYKQGNTTKCHLLISTWQCRDRRPSNWLQVQFSHSQSMNHSLLICKKPSPWLLPEVLVKSNVQMTSCEGTLCQLVGTWAPKKIQCLAIDRSSVIWGKPPEIRSSQISEKVL